MMIDEVIKKKVIGTFYLPGFVTQDSVEPIRPLYIPGVDIKLPDASINMVDNLSKMGRFIRIKIVPYLNAHDKLWIAIGFATPAMRYRKICAKVSACL